MTFRVLSILVTACATAAGVVLVAAEPDPLALVAGKLGEGGMWTALAVFIPLAAILAFWPRDGTGRMRPPFARRR